MNSLKLDIHNKTIAIFSANYLPHLGGVENFTYNLSEQLEKTNNHAIIITSNVFNLAEHEVSASGAEIFRLPCHSLMDGRLPIPHKNRNFIKLLYSALQQNIDYVVINTRFYPLSLIAADSAKQLDIKPIVIDHGSAYLTLNNPIIDSFIKVYEHVITSLLKRRPCDYYGISQASLEWLKTFHIKAKGVINNSIDADAYFKKVSKRNFRLEFGLHDEDFLVCFIGRLIPEKGIIPLVESAEYYSRTNSNIHFVLAGDGPLKQFVIDKNLKNIHLSGIIAPNDVASLLTQSNVLCLPSRSEGFATSLLEASACYTPSIVTNVGGVAELIPSSKYGIVIKDASQADICKAIEQLYNNQINAIQIGENVGRRVRKLFSWQETTKKVLWACQQANN